MTQGKFELSRTFTDNGEGVDVGYAINFYGRWKFFLELQPYLEAAADAGEDARVVSILAAGLGAKMDRDDLGLRKSWSIPKSFNQGECWSCAVPFKANVSNLSSLEYPGPTYTDLLAEVSNACGTRIGSTYLTDPLRNT